METSIVFSEYNLTYSNGSQGPYILAPHPLFYLHMSNTNVSTELSQLVGVCLNDSISISLEGEKNLDISPIVTRTIHLTAAVTLNLFIKIREITSDEDFAIFKALQEDRSGEAYTMLEHHRGVNAVDQWGQTPLMLA